MECQPKRLINNLQSIIINQLICVLAYHRVKKEPKYDTAGSAKYIKEQGLNDCAAIASDLAAGLELISLHDNLAKALYTVHILFKNIEYKDRSS